MCRQANPKRRGIAGFTLIEALAALAVMGAGLAAIGPLASSQPACWPLRRTASRGDRNGSQNHCGHAVREALPVGRLTGALDAHDWRIDSTLIGPPAAVGDALWTPQRIEVSVRSPSGAMLKIDTIRLRRQATKNEAGEYRHARRRLLADRGDGDARVDRDHHPGAVIGGRAMAPQLAARLRRPAARGPARRRP